VAKKCEDHEHKKEEEALQEANKHITSILESIADGCLHLDPEGCCIYINRRAEELSGLNRDMILGKNIWEAVPSLHGSLSQQMAEQAMRTQQPIEFEEFFPVSQRWFKIHDVPSAAYLAVYYRDISDLKMMQQETRERNELFRRLFEANLLGTTVSNSQGAIIEANDAFLQMVGYSREELQAGKVNWRALSAQETAHLDDQAVAEMHESGVCHPYEKEYIHKEGYRVPVMLAAAHMGGTDHDVAIVVDLSVRKEIEKQREMLLSIVSHELRTPLTSIVGTIQLAQRRVQRYLKHHPKLDAGTREFLESIDQLQEQAMRQARVQNRLIDDLLDASRLALDRLELSLQLHDLVSIVRETVEDMSSMEADHELVVSLPEQEKLPVYVDSTRIAQVITNYINNAHKYASPGTPIRVEIRVTDSEASVWVHDQGPGLDKEVQHQIWKRFYRVSGVQDQSGEGVNLGLGLHICQMLIERHGGQVGVESEPGKGASFWFSLPVGEEAKPAS
jgi:PAS domain S-box-containing protein